MPEEETSVKVENPDVEDTSETEDGTHDTTEEHGDEDTGQEAEDYAELDQETLIEALHKRDDENTKLEKSRREFQSMHDRQYSEQSNQISTLEGMVQTLVTQKKTETTEVDSTTAAKANDALAEKWRAEIEEKPERAVDLVLDTLGNVDAMVAERVAAALQGVESKVSDLDPDYRENKDMVDLLVEKTGIDRKSAINTVKALTESKSIVRQPEKIAAPGMVGSATRTTAEPPKKAEIVELDAHITEVANGLGLDEAAMKRLRTVDA